MEQILEKGNGRAVIYSPLSRIVSISYNDVHHKNLKKTKQSHISSTVMHHEDIQLLSYIVHVQSIHVCICILKLSKITD